MLLVMGTLLGVALLLGVVVVAMRRRDHLRQEATRAEDDDANAMGIERPQAQ
jgi:hypothetical protein